MQTLFSKCNIHVDFCHAPIKKFLVVQEITQLILARLAKNRRDARVASSSRVTFGPQEVVESSMVHFSWDMFTCHLHSSVPLASSLHAAKSVLPAVSPLQFPNVSPVNNTDPSFPIATPLISSSSFVPPCPTHDENVVKNGSY